MSRLRKIGDWLDERTGHRRLIRAALDEPVVGGARWSYVFGSALVIVLVLQAVTGVMLTTAYSPGTETAWASVHYITYKMDAGWLVRGVHHFGAQAMVVLLGMHLLQVSVYGAYKRPREVNFWFGLVLMATVLGFALTGYLLPWDQKGYFATRVATNIAGTVPVAGGFTQRFLQGGPEYGALTLTRFYSLHVVVLPALTALAVAVHIALFRKHGITPPLTHDAKKVDLFFPKQVWKDLQAAIVVFGIVLYFAFREHGADLDAPADPASDYPARPEWYFLPLFELLKHLHGPLEIVGTVGIPLIAGAYLVALPFLDKKATTALRPRLPILAPLFLGGIGGIVLLAMALNADAHDEKFLKARADADKQAKRAIALAMDGVPREGPLAMMKNDPETLGPKLFDSHCATCHVLGEHGDPKKSSAPWLDGWGTEAWARSMLDDPDHESRFGRTPFDGMMPSQTKCPPAKAESCKPLAPEDASAVTKTLAAGADPSVTIDDATRKKSEAIIGTRCTGCHLYKGQGDDAGIGQAPELAGWGTEAWIASQIRNPATKDTYRDKALDPDLKGHMPRFDGELSASEIKLLSSWVRKEARERSMKQEKGEAQPPK
jgi:ubiquinol-cytochrome c reductase cytochrome b subunit